MNGRPETNASKEAFTVGARAIPMPESCVVGVIVLADLEPGSYRPSDPLLASVVAAVNDHGASDVVTLAKTLDARDPSVGWCRLLVDAMIDADLWLEAASAVVVGDRARHAIGRYRSEADKARSDLDAALSKLDALRDAFAVARKQAHAARLRLDDVVMGEIEAMRSRARKAA